MSGEIRVYESSSVWKSAFVSELIDEQGSACCFFKDRFSEDRIKEIKINRFCKLVEVGAFSECRKAFQAAEIAAQGVHFVNRTDFLLSNFPEFKIGMILCRILDVYAIFLHDSFEKKLKNIKEDLVRQTNDIRQKTDKVKENISVFSMIGKKHSYQRLCKGPDLPDIQENVVCECIDKFEIEGAVLAEKIRLFYEGFPRFLYFVGLSFPHKIKSISSKDGFSKINVDFSRALEGYNRVKEMDTEIRSGKMDYKAVKKKLYEFRKARRWKYWNSSEG